MNNNILTLIFQHYFHSSSLTYTKAIKKLCLNSDKGNNNNSKIITNIINDFNEFPDKYLSFRESLFEIHNVNQLLLAKQNSIESFANGSVFLLSPSHVAVVFQNFDAFIKSSRSHQLQVFEMADSNPNIIDIVNTTSQFVDSELAWITRELVRITAGLQGTSSETSRNYLACLDEYKYANQNSQSLENIKTQLLDIIDKASIVLSNTNSNFNTKEFKTLAMSKLENLTTEQWNCISPAFEQSDLVNLIISIIN